ncbi:MAG TPA: metalloregulator ArsR/SmtB family transcription factor [Pseudomonas sp.]|jgi:DNA-binding transcriptional ArsR family regulator|nr:metalloregulator ArsR/SmtB family transcription factor [Pseudomonas sp.]
MSDHPPLSIEDLRRHAGDACNLLKVLGNEDRLLLLCQLSSGPHAVCELEAALGIRQPTLSQQLAVLRQNALVHTERDGKHIRYSLANADVERIMRTLWDIYCA